MAPRVSQEVSGDEGLERLLAVVDNSVRGKGYPGVSLVTSVGCVGCDCIVDALEAEGLFIYRMRFDRKKKLQNVQCFLLGRLSLFIQFFRIANNGSVNIFSLSQRWAMQLLFP